jgi:hypothetical protein
VSASAAILLWFSMVAITVWMILSMLHRTGAIGLPRIILRITHAAGWCVVLLEVVAVACWFVAGMPPLRGWWSMFLRTRWVREDIDAFENRGSRARDPRLMAGNPPGFWCHAVPRYNDRDEISGLACARPPANTVADSRSQDRPNLLFSRIGRMVKPRNTGRIASTGTIA